jgi:hypothetical protein
MTFSWEELFSEGSLPDKRLRHRAARIGKACSERPGAAMTEAFDEWRDTRTAYNFFANRRVSFAALLDSPMTVVGRAIRGLAEGVTVLNVQDTTELNLSHLRTMTGLGEIGNPKDRGLFLHPSLAISTDGVPLGVLSAQLWARQPEAHGKARKRKTRAFEDKESLRWWTAIEQAERRVERPGILVHVGDRENDVYEVFSRAQKAGYRLLVRAGQDRKVEGEPGRLWSQVASFPSCRKAKPIFVPARPAKEGKPARAARETSVTVRYGAVTLNPPAGCTGSIRMWAVEVVEIDPTAGVEPIEWLLLSSDPISSAQEAWQRVHWYRSRWRIEEFFQVLKTGCRVEARQFESRETYEASLAIALLTAVRILALVKQARRSPGAQASVALSDEEEQVLIEHAKRNRTLDPGAQDSLRLEDAVELIAKLGGYKARSCDGPPGWLTLWRGVRRLEAMVDGYRLAMGAAT